MWRTAICLQIRNESMDPCIAAIKRPSRRFGANVLGGILWYSENLGKAPVFAMASVGEMLLS